ncbi:MAG TPA: signal peptidase I [Stellaceae bacterium]|nr:signal peptidase I [Stellaceae bacterium]
MEEKSAEFTTWLIETVKTIVYALVIAMVIRTVLVQPFNIPSPSMVPTLLVGDFIFVTKYSYGYSHYSLPFSPNIFSGRIFEHHPERGEVIVFRWPQNPSIDYVKRLIGLPGDRIQMKHGNLYINGELVKREKVGTYIDADGTIGGTYTRYMETLPNGYRHVIIKIGDSQPLDDTPLFTVPEGHYFFMGDDRDHSSDSRDPNGGVGYVPAENLIGHVQFIFFSTSGYADWWEIWKWPFTIRYSRLLSGVH